MEFINIHSDKDTIVMVLNEEADFTILLDVIRDRLTILKEHDGLSIRKIRFELGRRELLAAELMHLFDTVLGTGIAVIEGIEVQPKYVSPIEIHEGSIRSGEHVYYQNSVMILGDIHPNGAVTARQNVYVVGKIQGKVIIKSQTGKIVSSGYRSALLQFFDSPLQLIERFEAGTATYDNGQVKLMEGYGQRGEMDVTNHRRNVR